MARGVRTSPRRARAPWAAAAALLAALALQAAPARAGEIVVVVHDGVPAQSLTAQDVKRILLGDRTFIGETKLHVMGYLRDDPVADAFLKAVLGMSANAYRRYWVKEVFRSGRLPPRNVAGARAVLRHVAEEPGGIGFVPAEVAAGAAGVRVVFSVTVP
jgi:hypothetical protein